MKTVWIVLGVLAVLGVACCAGVFFMGKGLYTAVGDMTKGADEYSARVFPEIAQDWSFDVLRRESSPEFKAQVSDDTIKGLLNLYKTKLGKVQSVEKFTSDNFQIKNINGESVSLVTTKANAQFEKGPAKVELECIKRGDTWQLLGIKLQSDKLIQ